MTAKKRFWLQQSIVVSALILVIILLIATSCEQHKLAGNSALRGRWVESIGGTDTLEFSSLENEAIVSLLRGKEWVNGQWIFKSSGGSYHYTLSEDVISLQWFASSSTAWQQYPFHADGNSLIIGNFYDDSRRGMADRYVRIQ